MSEKAIYKAFGRAIATRRNELGLTQEKLAVKIGLSRASIASIESGRQNVLLHQVYSLALALEFSNVSELLPALPKPNLQGEITMPLSDETVTAHNKAQINDVITNALKQHSAQKVSS